MQEPLRRKKKRCFIRPELFAAFALTSLLAACGGMPVQNTGGNAPAPTAGEAPAKPTISASSPRPGVQKRGGGYYKDDGPGDNPPPNLDDIPDAEPKAEPLKPASNRPYSALGMNFTPLQQVQPFSQRGIASWYGKRFHGAKTSSGEPYDMYSMTGAHPTLPIPSYARVTNVANGKTVVVRINDRGPFHSDRVIDLSYTAAWKLGYADRGSAEVILEAIVPDELDMLIADKTKTSVPFQNLSMNAPANTGGAGTSTRTARGATSSRGSAALLSRGAVAQSDSTSPSMAAKSVAQVPTQTSSAGSGAVSGSTAAPGAATTAAQTILASSTPSTVSDTSSDRRGIFLQLGAFSLSANADSFREHVSHQLKWLKEEVVTLLVEGKYRLHVGPFRSTAEARDTSDRIARALNVRPFLVER